VTGRGDAGRTVLRGVGQTLVTAGIVVLLFTVYELYFTGVYTGREQSRLGDGLRQSWAAPAAPAARVLPGGALAEIWIPRIGMVGDKAKVVIEGVDHEDLKKGPGHYPGTALPGQVGNTVISGHRTTYGAPFNRLDEVLPGDPVVIETRDTWFTYKVTSQQVVPPTAVDVTYPVPGNATAKPTQRLLTLTTCNPKYSAQTRLILHGVLLGTLAKAGGGRPPALNGKA
jgi:sortase A